MYDSDLVQVNERHNSVEPVWQQVKTLSKEEKAEIVRGCWVKNPVWCWCLQTATSSIISLHR
jgi:hypothetical protein